MRPTKLNDDQVRTEMQAVPAWRLVDGQEITREYKFEDFKQAMAFVNRIADAAEAMDHHPDIDIRYNKVTLRLSTHDAGGITANDFLLARQADQLILEKTL